MRLSNETSGLRMGLASVPGIGSIGVGIRSLELRVKRAISLVRGNAGARQPGGGGVARSGRGSRAPASARARGRAARPGWASSPWSMPSMLRQKSAVRAIAPRRARPAVERPLQLPRGAVQRRERRVDRRLVRRERRRAAGEQVEDRVGREARRVRSTRTSRRPRPGRSARPRRRRASARSPAIRVPGMRSGSRWPRRFSSCRRVEAVRLARRAAGARGCFGPSSCQPPTPTFAWSPFGKTQRVAARDVGELDHDAARVALARDRRVRDVPLVRDAVGDPAAEPDRPAR